MHGQALCGKLGVGIPISTSASPGMTVNEFDLLAAVPGFSRTILNAGKQVRSHLFEHRLGTSIYSIKPHCVLSQVNASVSQLAIGIVYEPLSQPWYIFVSGYEISRP